MKPLEQYKDGDTIYYHFSSDTNEQDIYIYAYRQAIKSNMKVGNLTYVEGNLQIILKPF